MFFKKFWEKRNWEEQESKATAVRKQTDEEIFAKVEEQRKEDPYIGVKLGAEDIYNILCDSMRDSEGKIDANSLLFYTAGLTGYVCQAAVWEKYVVRQKIPVNQVFHVVSTEIGKDFYFGDAINQYVLESQYSVWRLVAGMYQHLYQGAPAPDIIPIVDKIASVIGKEDYKLCGAVSADDIIEQYHMIWNSLKPRICRYCAEADEWPILFGLVMQKVMELAKDVVAPEDCINIVMESVIYLSKVDISANMGGIEA